MLRLFDHQLPPARLPRDPRRQEEREPPPALAGDAPARIWRHLLDRGADPIALAALLRDGVPQVERQRAFLALVHSVGAPLAHEAWSLAFADAPGLQRRAFPEAPRQIAEAALGRSLIGIDVVTGELVDLLTARLGTPAFTLGSEVFVSAGGAAAAVLVHEAIHTAQQQGAPRVAPAASPSRAAEDDAHRVLKRIGPLDERPGFVARERARAALAVRAALGRAPQLPARPVALAAYEPTAGVADVLAEGRKLAAALTRLVAVGAAGAELQAVLGPLDDARSARIRQVALHELAQSAGGPAARAALVERLGPDAAAYLAAPGRALPATVRAELEPRLGVSLADVRVHDDELAHRRAAQLDAAAFTEGADIYFADGRFDPATRAGRQLLAHELAHVAQQAGAAATSAPASAVEREADRVADAITAGVPARVQERVAAGTIARKEASAPTSSSHKWVVSLLHQALDLDPSTATDAHDGTRKLHLPRARVGPINLRDAHVTLDATGAVAHGTLTASVDDGRFRGSAGTLRVDKDGNVTGALEVAIAVPGAFVKPVRLDYGADGLHASVQVAPQDFASKDLPITASNMRLEVTQGAGGLAVALRGDVTAGLDKGFAGGSGKLTAALSTSGTPTIAADIEAALAVPGLDAAADAKLHWDGKSVDVVGAASVALKLPGVSGTAQLSYQHGRLVVKVPDFAFTWKPLGDRLKLAALTVDDGKLSGSLAVAQAVTIDLPGVALTVGSGSNLAIAGDELSGALVGRLLLGGRKSPIFDGDFSFAWQEGRIDGSVVIHKALLPWLQVADLHVAVKDLGGANDWSFGGDIDISFRQMRSRGRWKLPRFAGGSLLGDFHLDLDFPKIKLPSLDFSLGPDWRVALPKLPDFKIDLDLGALLGSVGDFFGKLPHVDVALGLKDTDLFNLDKLVGGISFTGLKIHLPKLSLAFLDKLELHLPELDWSKLSGLMQLKLDLPKLDAAGLHIPALDLGVDAGKLVGKLALDVDVGKILKFLKGKLRFRFDSSLPGFLHVDGLGLTLADLRLAKYAKAAIAWLDGKLSGRLGFEHGQLPWKGISFRIVGGEIKLDDLTPSGFIEVEAAGAKNKATARLSYDENGELELEGKLDLDAAALTRGWLGGTLSASNYGGETTLGGKVDFLKGPLVGKVTGIDATYNVDKSDFAAKFHLKAAELNQIKGVTVSGFDAAIAIRKSDDGIALEGDATGHVTVGKYFDGQVTAGYRDGKFFGRISTQPGGLRIKLPAGAKLAVDQFSVLLDEELRLADGDAKLGINLYDFVTGELGLHVAAHAITGFHFTGRIAETRFTEAVNALSLSYLDGAWKGETAVHFKALGGILDEGASVTVKGGADGLGIEAKDVAFKKGLLKGFRVDEVHYDDKTFGGTLSGGKDLQVGPVKASISPGATVSFDKVAGLGGQVAGELKFGKVATASFRLSGTGDGVDVAVTSKIQLAALSKALTGEVTVGYDSHRQTFTFEALNPGFAEPSVRDIAKIDHVKYDGHDFDIAITIPAGREFSAGGERKAKVLGGHVAWKHGMLDGEIKGRIEGAAANATVSVGWKNGEFFLGAGGEFDLAKLTGGQLTGRVQAEGDSGGNAKFKLLGEVKIAKLQQLTIKSLEGNLQGGSFKIGVDFDSLGQTVNIPLVKLSRLGGGGKLSYDHGTIGLDGEIHGAGSVVVGNKEIVKGSFALSVHDGELGGTVTVDAVPLSKRLEPEKLTVAYEKQKTTVGGGLSFEVPHIFKRATIHDLHIDLAANKLDFQSELSFQPDALKDITAHVGMKDGKLDLAVKLTGQKKINAKGAELTLEAGTHVAYDQASDAVSGKLVGAAKLGRFAGGTFDLAFAGGKLDGALDLTVGKVPLFKAGTAIAIRFDNGVLSTAKDIVLELDDKYKQYIDAKVVLSVHGGDIKVEGRIDHVKKLGALGRNIRDGRIWYDAKSEKLGAQGTLDLSSVRFLDAKSQVTLSLDSDLNFGAKGHLGFKPIGGGVKLEGALDFEWAPGKFIISGGIDGDIHGLAKLTLRASSSKADEGERTELSEEHLKYNLAGKLTATGLANQIHGLRFREPPSVSFWVTGGDGSQTDYGMDDFSTHIIQLPGIGKCDVELGASYAKDKGFNAHVAIKDLQYKMFKLTGGFEIKESKFVEGSVGIESTLKAVNLKGGVTIHAGELDKLNADAALLVAPTSGKAIKWLQSGAVNVSLKDGNLDKAEGTIVLQKPPLLPLDQTTITIGKNGDDLYGSLDTTFDVPFSKGKKGHLVATFGGPDHWSVAIEAEIKPPGFKSGRISGSVDGDGTFEVGGALEADSPKLIREGRVKLGYAPDKGIYLEGGVTLKLTDSLDGSVDIEYDQRTDDFLFVGEIKTHPKPPSKAYHELGGYEYELDIPIASIGVASLDLELGAAFSIGYIEPYVEFRDLKISGSLHQIEDGTLPEISAAARFGMGARAHFSLSIGVVGKIDIIIATAKAGINGSLVGDADLNAFVDAGVTFGGNHDGVDIDVDATVNGGIHLEADLTAFLKAKVCGFTIVHEEWPLASFPIADIKLPEWKPFDPFTWTIGGSNPGFKGGKPGVKQETPPGLNDGASDASNAAEEESKAEKAKEKTRPVMEGIKEASHLFEALPPNWQEGLHAQAVSVDDFVGCDDDAWDFYAEKAGDAEDWFPELAARTPPHRMAKAVAIVARDDDKKAGEMILAWQRAQIAHLGINPDSGVNLVQEREEIMDLQQREYAKEKAEADRKQAIADAQFAVAVAKQLADWLIAEAAHEKKIEDTKKQYEHTVAQTKKEGDAAHKRLLHAEEHAKHEHVSDDKAKAAAGAHDAPVAPPPPAPVAPPHLQKPEPLRPPPPLPQPTPPAPLPPVVVPHEPQDIEDLKPGGEVPVSDDGGPSTKAPKAQRESPKGTPPDSQAVAESNGAVGKMPTVTPTKPSGKMDASIGPADGKSGPSDVSGPPPAMIEGAGDMSKQGQQLDALLVAEGGEAKNAMRSGDFGAMMEAHRATREQRLKQLRAAAAAPPGAAGSGAATGGVDVTVQKVAAEGKAAEDKQAADAAEKESSYAAHTKAEGAAVGEVERSLAGEEKTAQDQIAKHTLPAELAFPLPTLETVRTAYSNWTRLGLSGETMQSFLDKRAEHFFDFETRVWGRVVEAYQKLLDRTPLADPLPDAADFSQKLWSGYSHDGKAFTKAARFDPAYSLSEDAIAANETLERFKLVYKGCGPADYLIHEAEKLEEMRRAAFASSVLAPIAKSYAPQKALRAALDRLGPSAEVQKQLGIVDAGRLVDAHAFWVRALAAFTPHLPGIEQVNNLVRAMQEAKKAPADAQKGAPPRAEKPAEDQKEPTRLAHFADVAAKVEALRGDRTFEAMLARAGVDPSRDAAANQAALLARRRKELVELARSRSGAPPAEVHGAWLAVEKQHLIEQNRAAAALSLAYATLIAELRARRPRLDQEGVARACAELRRRVGSNALRFVIGDVNPADVQPAERVDSAVADAAVDGADWNPLLQKDWLERVYEKLDPSLFAEELAKGPAAPVGVKKPDDDKRVQPKPADGHPLDGKADAMGAKPDAPPPPPPPRALVEPKPVELERPKAGKELIDAPPSSVIFAGDGGTPQQITEALLARHPDARLDRQSGTLTLPALDAAALALASSLAALGRAIASQTGVDKVLVQKQAEPERDGPTRIVRRDDPLPPLGKQGRQRIELFGQINPITKLISLKLDAATALLDAQLDVPVGTSEPARTVKLLPADWEHIVKSHVRDKLDPSLRGSAPKTTIFEGTPQAYADLLEEACQNAAVARDLGKNDRIELKLRNRAFMLMVDSKAAAIKSFFCKEPLPNDPQFTVWRLEDGKTPPAKKKPSSAAPGKR